MTPEESLQRFNLKLVLETLYPILYNTTDDPRGQANKAIAIINDILAKQKDLVGAPEKNFVDPLGAPENKKLE
jgi:hypothetical protein